MSYIQDNTIASYEPSDQNDCEGKNNFGKDKTLASVMKIDRFIEGEYHEYVQEIHMANFSKQIYLREYLERFFTRYRQLEIFKDDSVISPDVQQILTKQTCLEAATELHRLAKEKYERLKYLEQVYKDKKSSGESTTKKRFLNFKYGRVYEYTQMLFNFNSCFYLTMFKFSEAIFTMETELQEKLSHEQMSETMTQILGSLNLESLTKLLYATHNLSPDSEASGGSKRHTRRRRHRHRHSYSLCYRKLLKRSKKSKKNNKITYKKRHNHIRKQNKSKK